MSYVRRNNVKPPAPDSIFESDMGQLCHDCRSIFIPVSGNQAKNMSHYC